MFWIKEKEGPQSLHTWARILGRVEKKACSSFIVRWCGSKRRPLRLFFLLLGIVLAFWLIGVFVAWGKPGESVYDSLSALFSGLAFAGLFCALVMQKQELSLQRKELEDTREATVNLGRYTYLNTKCAALNSQILNIDRDIDNINRQFKEISDEIFRGTGRLMDLTDEFEKLKNQNKPIPLEQLKIANDMDKKLRELKSHLPILNDNLKTTLLLRVEIIKEQSQLIEDVLNEKNK